MTDYNHNALFLVVFDDGVRKTFHAPSWDLLVEHLVQSNFGDDEYIISITKLPEDIYS